MTEEEKTLLINEIADYLISHSQSVEGILEATDLDGVSSLPAIKEILNEESQVVRIPLTSILPKFRYANGYLQYRYLNSNWVNLFKVSTSLDWYATKDYVDLNINSLISEAPVTLNTLNKIASALNYDPNFYQNIYQDINAKWTTNNAKIAQWDQAYADRHVHDNISSLQLINDILIDKWNQAYAWGDHSQAGYEYDLGNPVLSGQILSSDTNGHRSWVDMYQHPVSGVVPNIYTKVTVDINGHVTYGAPLIKDDIPSISWNQVPFDRPNTIEGYGITDAYTKLYIDRYLQRKYSGIVDIDQIIIDGNTISVPSCKANLYDNAGFKGYVSPYDIAAKSFTLTGEEVRYIVISYNGGSPEYIITQERSVINYSNVIPVITVIYDGVKIHSVNWDEQANGLSERILKRLNRTQRFQRDGGLLINVDGSRTITISQSTIYFGASEVVYPSSSSSTNLIYQYHHSDGVWTYIRSQFLNNLEYDNGTGLVSLSNDNRYTVNWVYAGVGDDGDIITVLGNGDYKLDEVINAQPPSILPDIIRFHCILVGKVIYQKGLNTPYQVISLSEQSISSGGSVVEHNNLNGLQGGNLEEFYHLNHSEYLNAQDSSSFSSTPGTYRSVTTDSKGRVISGTNPTTLSEYGISDEDVTNSLLTGYALGQNTEVSSTDSIIGSIGKLQAYINARQGTVTSVGISVPLGFTVLNSPITTNGIIGLGYAEGYSLPSNSIQSNWSSAYAYSLIEHLPLTGGNLSGNLGITGDLNISGIIYQSGSIYETHAENIYSKNDYIYMRDEAASGLLDGFYSGLEFVKYDGVNNGRLAIDSYGVARVGDVGDEQPLATREETPLSNGYAYWDNTNKRFSTKLIPFSEIANKPTTLTGYGITDAQPLDADLSSISALIGTSGLLRKTAANTWSLDTNIYLTAITKAQVEAVLTGDIATHIHGQYLTGNQTITVSGDVTGSGTTAIALTLANSGVEAGIYNNSATQVRPFTVDTKGRITSIGTAVTITPDWGSITSRPTTIGGYGITDAYTKTQTDGFLALKLDSSIFNDLFEKVNVGTEASPVYEIKAKYNFHSDSGTGDSGLIQTVYGLSDLGGTYSDDTLTDTFNAYTINSLHNRINSLESGSVIVFTTVGSGNAVTSVTKSGTSVTVTKGLTFSVDGHTHSYLPLSGGTLSGNLTAPTFSGTLSGNASTATQLQTARTIWGQSFDGNGDVSGAMSGVTNLTMSGILTGGTISYFSSYSSAKRFFTGYDSGQTNSISCSNWFRSNGGSGWVNETYGGGIYMADSTYVRVYNSKSFFVNNNIVITGEVTSVSASDSRLKDNIEPISFALDFLGRVKTYEFEWNDTALSLNPLKTKKGAGVIAQEIQHLDSDFVHSIYGDYLGVDYERFIPYLIGGVNEVNSKTITLGKRLDDTDSEVYKLKLRISELENKLRYYEHN